MNWGLAMTDNKNLSDAELEQLFEEMAASNPVPTTDLVARIIADADGVMNDRATGVIAVQKPLGLRQRLASFLSGIGGWPAVAGLATATVAGIWIGYAPPSSVSDLASSYISTDVSYDIGDYIPSFDLLSVEG